jgi:serine protease AprX
MRTSLFPFLFLIPFLGNAQSGPKQYWIQFSDKDNTPFELSEPLEFLSQRALDRRSAQNIALNTTDLPVDPAYVQAVLNEGATYLTHSKWFNSVTVHVPDSSVLNAILNLPFVLQDEPVGKTDKQNDGFDKLKIDDKSLSAGADTETDYGAGFNQIDMLAGLNLHDAGYKGQGMLIAVLDAGFTNVDVNPAFDSLRNDNRILGTWDFVARNDSVYNDNSHGAMVLSTMASNWSGFMIGTAPNASYILLRTENADSEYPIEEDYWVAGAEYADSAGADIINSSLGYTTFQNSIYDHSYADMDGNTTRGAIGGDMAAAKGILVVNSAGNSGDNSWQYIGTPADGDSVLAIGAVTAEGLIANFSSIGPSADGDIKPNVCAQGQQAAVVNTGGDVILGNGTSFSGPILAGMAACLWQANPHMTNMEIFHAIEQSAHLFQEPNGYFGFGIPNFAMANLILSGYSPSDLDQCQLFPAYPNPFTDQLTGAFYSSVKQRIKIQLVGGTGQPIDAIESEISKTSAMKFQFNGLQKLAEGVYYLQVLTDSDRFSSKVVKLRD